MAPTLRPSIVMNVADALPVVIFTSRPVKYTTEPVGSVRPESPYCGFPSTLTLIHTESATRTPTTSGRAWNAGDAAAVAGAPACADGLPATTIARWSTVIRRHAYPANA